jgi:hypothetical protein
MANRYLAHSRVEDVVVGAEDDRGLELQLPRGEVGAPPHFVPQRNLFQGLGFRAAGFSEPSGPNLPLTTCKKVCQREFATTCENQICNFPPKCPFQNNLLDEAK